MDIDEVDLSSYGAPGFSLDTRLDLSGHQNGRVDPHINVEVTGQQDQVVSRDLTTTQLPGMNGMQND